MPVQTQTSSESRSFSDKQFRIALNKKRHRRRAANRKYIRDEIMKLTGETPCDYIMKQKEQDPKFHMSNRDLLDTLRSGQ